MLNVFPLERSSEQTTSAGILLFLRSVEDVISIPPARMLADLFNLIEHGGYLKGLGTYH